MYTPMNIINMSPCKPSHVHEFLGSTHFAEANEAKHNHRFAGVTCEAIDLEQGRHIHEYCTYTDTVDGHHHVMFKKTGPNIQLSNCRHIHYADFHTSVNDGHKHRYEFATLIGPSPVNNS